MDSFQLLLLVFAVLVAATDGLAFKVEDFSLHSADAQTYGQDLMQIRRRVLADAPKRKRRRADGIHGQHPDNVYLNFSVHGEDFHYLLTKNTLVFSNQSKAGLQTETNQLSEFDILDLDSALVNYKGANAVLSLNGEEMSARAILKDYIVEINRGDNGITVETEYEYTHGFGIFPNGSEPVDDSLLPPEGTRRRLQIERWTDCFPQDHLTRRFSLGLAITYNLYNGVFKQDLGAVMAWVESLVSSANLVYENQLNVVLAVNYVYVVGTPTGVGDGCSYGSACQWNNPTCELSGRDQLRMFTAWSKGEIPPESRVQGIWHIVDDCDYNTDKKVGLAYIGVLCQPPYNTAFSEYAGTETIDETWLTFMHEVGHNFGAFHSFEEGIKTTGGIMDYGDFKLDNVVQFNSKYRKEEICSEIAANVETCSAFSMHVTTSPTPMPTKSPTLKPTPFPTNRPTPRPLQPIIPGPSPTSAPTSAPSKKPTARPTQRPTDAPTKSSECVDASPTGIFLSVNAASESSCPELAQYCEAYETVRKRCCKTCSPDAQPTCVDQVPSGIRYKSGELASCPDLKAHCKSYIFVEQRCCATCAL